MENELKPCPKCGADWFPQGSHFPSYSWGIIHKEDCPVSIKAHAITRPPETPAMPEVTDQQPETAAAIRDDTRTMLIATAEGLAEATKRNAALQERIDGLVEALRNVMPWVFAEYLRCNGDKCRHITCASCFGEEQADEQSDKGALARQAAEAALAAQGDD